MAIRIIIADDADLVISGAQQVLDNHYRFRVSGTARSMNQLKTEINLHQPDVVLISEWIHNIDILSAVDQIQTLSPEVKIIVMGGLADGLLIRDLFGYGVKGYLYKSDDLCELLPIAVETVMIGRLYLSPTANSEFLITSHNPYPHQALEIEDRQVLQMLAHGDEVGEIAEQLNVSLRHIYWVREKLRSRFGARTNEHLIQRAIVEGFIYPRE